MATEEKTILRDLGNGLIMRRSSPRDAEALPEFNALLHGENEADARRVAAWTLDLLIGPHPTFHADDFTVVEDTSTGKIVSSLNLIPQTWSYEGIEFAVGRPELVGTLPEYRGRGIIRAQFEEIHKWCLERGIPVQIITGIPYFYRQFGYEMALDLLGRRFGYEPQVPPLKEGEKEKYLIRPAVKEDLPFIADVYAHAVQHHMMRCVRSHEIFEYELFHQRQDSPHYYETGLIEDRAGESLGYIQYSNHLDMTGLTAVWYELKPGLSWLDVTPAVIRFLWNKGREYAERNGRERTTFGFMCGAEHPVYQALGRDLPSVREPYAYQIRVPDLPGFLDHIKPVLEKRLAGSIACGHSREIKVSFYRDGLRIVIEQGRITAIEKWRPMPKEEGDIALPDRTFLQMLFGYRSYDELHAAFADCWCDTEEVRVLMNILFPKKLSDIFPVA